MPKLTHNDAGKYIQPLIKKETRTYEITNSPEELNKFERFLALLHYNSSFGHSGIFAMPFDGDGSDVFKVKGLDRQLQYEVDCINSVGYDIEIAYGQTYSGLFIDRKRKSNFYTGKAANLYKDGDIIKTIPTCDWEHNKNR